MYFFIFLSNILGGQALVYLIPRNKIELLVFPAYFWTAAVAVSGFAFLKTTGFITDKHIPSIAVFSFFSSIIIIHQTILLAKNKIITSNLISALAVLMQLTGVIICFYYFNIHDAYAYIYSSLTAYSFTALMSFIVVKPYVRITHFFSDFTWEDVKTSFRYGVLYQLAEVFQLLNLRFYFFQLGLQQGIQYLGVYSIGISILEAVWIIPRSISTVNYVSTSNSSKVKEDAGKTIRWLKLSIVISLIALLLIYLLPSSVYIFVFGEGFKDVKHSIRFLFPGILFYNLFLVISSFYFGIGRYLQLITSSFAGFSALVIAGHFLIPDYVMSGAGLAASISFTVSSLLLFTFFIAENKIGFSQFLLNREDFDSLKKLSKKLLSRHRRKLEG